MEYPHRTRKCKMSKPVVHKRTILLRMYVAPPAMFHSRKSIYSFDASAAS
jgi:hypothetical protein